MEYKLTENQIIDYLENHGWNKTKPGLERTQELLKRVGSPDKKLKYIHVAGTNGKGSILAMLSSVLIESGYKVGFYPSPYLMDFKERIQVNRKNISTEALERLGNIVIGEADAMEDHPTYFEMVTAIGMLYFVEEDCDIVMLETGMGGRLDSTNVIEKPEVTVIANIGLDHTEYLGDTIEKIAAEKAGIFKPGCPAVVYDNVDSVKDVLSNVAISCGCNIYFAPRLYEPQTTVNNVDSIKKDSSDTHITDKLIIPISSSIYAGMQSFEYDGITYTMNLLGVHQLKNVAVVLKTVEVLRGIGWNVSAAAVLKGLMNINWPARFQIMSTNPFLVLDGGHNPQCARALVANIKEYFGDKKVGFMLGILADKDVDEVLDILLPYAGAVICTTPDNPRAMNASELAVKVHKKTLKIGNDCEVVTMQREEACKYIYNIVNRFATNNISAMPLICFGSLYLAGDVLKTIENISE